MAPRLSSTDSPFFKLPEVKTPASPTRRPPIPVFETGMKKLSGQRNDKKSDINMMNTNLDVYDLSLINVYTYLNGLEIARLSDRYKFDFSKSNRLSKAEI